MTSDPRRVAQHVATALAAHVEQARRDGAHVPVEVIALGQMFAAAATARHDPTPRDGCSGCGEGEPVIEPALLSVRQVSAVLGCSTRSVERLLAAGDLPAVELAGVRVRRSDLDRYVEALPVRSKGAGAAPAAAAAGNAVAAGTAGTGSLPTTTTLQEVSR